MHQRKVEKEMQILVCFFGFGGAVRIANRRKEPSSTFLS